SWCDLMVVSSCFSSGVVRHCLCSERVEHLLHLGDLGLLVFNDLFSQGDGLRVLAISDLIAGHLDRALVVGGHLLQVEPGSLSALGVVEGCHVLLAHHPAHPAMVHPT